MGEVLELLRMARTSGVHADRQLFLAALFRETRSLLVAVARRYDPLRAEDLANDVFTFKVMPLDLMRFPNSDNELRGFLKVTAKNYCHDFIQRRSLEKRILASGIKDWFRNDREQRRMKDGELDLDFLARHLNPKQIQVVWLRIGEELEYGEIQRRLKLPSREAARQEYCRARKKLVRAYTTGIRSFNEV